MRRVVVVLADVLEVDRIRTGAVDLGKRVGGELHAAAVPAAVTHVVDLLEAHAAQVVSHVVEHRAVGGL